MSASEKLMLIWQAVHEDGSPLADTIVRVTGCDGVVSRSMARGDLKTVAKTSLGQGNFPEPEFASGTAYTEKSEMKTLNAE